MSGTVIVSNNADAMPMLLHLWFIRSLSPSPSPSKKIIRVHSIFGRPGDDGSLVAGGVLTVSRTFLKVSTGMLNALEQ
jgi:hypothetical protein